MEKIITHRGEFLSRSDVLHRVELWRIGGAAVAQPEELRFEADEPLVIEWKETAKHEPICSSSATLRLDSPGDRTYTHLYTITPGAVGMDVYRNGALYWTGTLDAEEYEEPYERAEHYTVSLTFGDFGIWQRLKYSTVSLRANRNVQTIGELLGFAIERAGLALALDESLTAVASTHPVGGGVAKWLGCSPENFFDEDRKAATLSEAIESLLQPLGLRVVQRVGRLLYDLHGLHSAPTAPPVVWSADSQTLSVDSVANNVRISFSPYAKNKRLSSDELKFPRPLRKVWSATRQMPSGRDSSGSEWTHNDTYLYSSEVHIKKGTTGTFAGGGSRGREYSLYHPSFLVGYADNPETRFGNDTRLCRFLPLVEGDEAVAYCVKAPPVGVQVLGKGRLPTGSASVIYETRAIYLPKVAAPELYCLRLRVPILADRAVCPFAVSGEDTADKRARDEMDKAFGWAHLTTVVRCMDGAAKNVRYFDNNHTVKRENSTAFDLILGSFVPRMCELAACWPTSTSPTPPSVRPWADGARTARISAARMTRPTDCTTTRQPTYTTMRIAYPMANSFLTLLTEAG